MKKLLVSIGTLSSGGAERVLSILSKSFADAFDSVEFAMWVSKPIFYIIDDRVKILDIENLSGSKSIFKKMWWFRKYVQKNRPDLILSFLYPWSMKLILSLLLDNTKIVVAERIDGRMVRGGLIIRLLRDILYFKASGILVQTEKNKSYYLKALRNRISVIYNPVIMPDKYLGSAVDSEKDNIVVSVGRLHPQKNQEMLIKAFGEFHKSHPQYKLYIYGEGELRLYLMNLIGKLGLHDVVFLPGTSNNLFSMIKHAKLFALPSDYEGMPNALMEAMCLGLPCISTKVSGAEELIEDGNNGLLIDVGDQKGMTAAIIKLADNNNLSNRISRNAVLLYKKVNRDIIEKEWITIINAFFANN